MSDAFTEQFEQYWGGQPVTSLRRLQAMYGAIAEAEAGSETVVPEAYRLYVTPGELNGFTSDESEGPRLITVNVDLTDEPTLAEISVSPSRPGEVSKLGFSRYPSGRGIDHSITRRGAKSGSSASTATNYCLDCLVRWTDADDREPAIGRVATEHDDGWVIEGLREVGQRDGIEDEIESQIEAQYGGGERVVATVAIKLDPEELSTKPTGEPEDGFYYPGQLHVLNAGMRARKEEKLARKNLEDSDPPSRGEAACLVTGERGEVFGTAEDPLALYTVQHAEKFQGLEKSEAWRAHPISSEPALLVQSGSSLVGQCRTTRHGRGVYTVPYFSNMTPDRARILLRMLEEATFGSQADMADVQRSLETRAPEFADALRFYVLVVRNDSGDINVLREAPDLSIQPAREVARSHKTVLDSSTFGVAAGFEQPEDWEPISKGIAIEDIVRSVVGGMYAYGTLSIPPEDDPAADDPTDWLTFALLGNETVPVERLLEEYVTRLVDDQREDNDRRLPENQLKAQYAQLEALARAGRLTSESTAATDALTRMPSTSDAELPPADQFRTAQGNISIEQLRSYRLDRFIEERPALDSTTNPARSSAFLAGVFVGQIGRYQSTERGMNRTALQQYPTEQMSGARIERLVSDLTDKANAYAMDDEHTGVSLFPELEDRLTEALTAVAGDWDIDTTDLRFHYALGQLYGKRATNRAFQQRDELEATTTN